jgi:LAGLIDADG endonuclease
MTAFLGYVLPYGQMSLWGMHKYSTNNLINNEPDKKFMAMFLGLVDGDGYIEIGPQKQYQKKTKLLTRSTIRARLVIRLNNRDRELLIYISERLKIGSISILHEINQTRLIFSKKDLTTVILPLIKKI